MMDLNLPSLFVILVVFLILLHIIGGEDDEP